MLKYMAVTAFLGCFLTPSGNAGMITSVADIADGTTIDFESPGTLANDVFSAYSIVAAPDQAIAEFVPWVAGNADAPFANRAIFGQGFRIETTSNGWAKIGISASGTINNASETRSFTLNAFDKSDNLLGSVFASFTPDGSQPTFNNEVKFLGWSSAAPIFAIELLEDSGNNNVAWDNLRFQSAVVPEPGSMTLFVFGSLCATGATLRRRRA